MILHFLTVLNAKSAQKYQLFYVYCLKSLKAFWPLSDKHPTKHKQYNSFVYISSLPVLSMFSAGKQAKHKKH